MIIVLIPIGLMIIWTLRSIAINQKIIAKNQVQIGEILKQINSKLTKN